MSQLKVIQNGEARLYSFEGPLPLSEALAEFGYAVSHPCGSRGTCGKCTVIVNGSPVLACRTTLCEDAEVILPDREKIASVTGAEESGQLTEQVCFCLDIGTTTLALALVSLHEKRIIRTVTAPNPQRAFGADVISRIDHCRKHGPAELPGLIPKELAGKLSGINNASLLGTVYRAGFPDESILPLDRAQYVDLSADPLFSQLFMEYMNEAMAGPGAGQARIAHGASAVFQFYRRGDRSADAVRGERGPGTGAPAA